MAASRAGWLTFTRASHWSTSAANSFRLTLDRVEAKRLFAAVPELTKAVTGEIGMTFRGQLGEAVRGSGTVSVENGSVGGITVSGLRIPFDVETVPGGAGRLTVRELAASSGAGKVQGSLTYDWGGESRLDGHFGFTNVRLASISPGIGSSSLFGGGRLTGRLDVGGTNIRSTDDLTGRLIARLNSTSVQQIPVLDVVTPFLTTPGMLAPFQTGDIQGQLSKGVFRVNRLALVSPSAQLHAEGSISLSGNLDLNVVAHTGPSGPQARGLQLLAFRLIPGTLPITLLKDASELLSNQTIRLSVTGSASSPTVKVNQAALLTENAVRFLLSRYVPLDVAGAINPVP